MRPRKAFLIASLVLLFLGTSAWQCGKGTPSPTPDEALREYVLKVHDVYLTPLAEIEELSSSFNELDIENMTTEEWLSSFSDTMGEMTRMMNDLLHEFEMIDPPPAAQDFHAGSIRCFKAIVSVGQRTRNAAVRGDVEGAWNGFLDVTEVDDCMRELEPEFNRLVEEAYPE